MTNKGKEFIKFTINNEEDIMKMLGILFCAASFIFAVNSETAHANARSAAKRGSKMVRDAVKGTGTLNRTGKAFSNSSKANRVRGASPGAAVAPALKPNLGDAARTIGKDIEQTLGSGEACSSMGDHLNPKQINTIMKAKRIFGDKHEGVTCDMAVYQNPTSAQGAFMIAGAVIKNSDAIMQGKTEGFIRDLRDAGYSEDTIKQLCASNCAIAGKTLCSAVGA